MSLVLNSINKVFGDGKSAMTAVDNFNFEIEKGQLVTLLGPSGCGKTTTLRMIAGFEVPSSGRILLEGEDVTNLPPNRRDISMVFQSYALFPHLDVSENIAFGLKIKKLDRKTIRRKVGEMVELVGLSGLEDRRPDQLSGGQQQRVALARGLVMEPKVLLFDEPLSNLDAKLRESMRLEIRRIQQTLGITSVYVTHDQVEAMSISDTVIVMDHGKMMQAASPFEIYAHPQNTFVADFIGRVDFLRGAVVSMKGEREAVVECGKLRSRFVCTAERPYAVGDEVVIALRPESLSNARGERENEIQGKVRKFVFLGSVMEIEFELDDGSSFDATIYDPIEQKIPVIGERRSLFFSRASAWAIRP